MKFILIKVYSEKARPIVCGCCDRTWVETKEWYRTIDAGYPYDHQKYLECCKDKMGEVVDWEEKL